MPSERIRVDPALYNRLKKIQWQMKQERGLDISLSEASSILERSISDVRKRVKKVDFSLA